MARPPRLIVGLGNPGERYAGSRHNVGFEVAAAAARRARLPAFRADGPALVAWGSWQGAPFGVALPQTFMNRSGEAVSRLVRRHALAVEDVLVVYDDLALEPGAVRLRPKGGAGSHNGMTDVILALDSENFPRLRIGIGSSFAPGGQVDYVLGRFTAEERPAIEDAVAHAAEAALTFVTDGVAAAMNRYNRR